MKNSIESATAARKRLNTDRYVKTGYFPRVFFAGLLERTIRDGGSTNFWTQDEEKCNDLAYIVGDGARGVVLSNRDFRSGVDLESFLAPYIHEWSETTEYNGFGTWVNPVDGSVFIDPITALEFRANARTLAVALKELAFFDRETGEVIFV